MSKSKGRTTDQNPPSKSGDRNSQSSRYGRSSQTTRGSQMSRGWSTTGDESVSRTEEHPDDVSTYFIGALSSQKESRYPTVVSGTDTYEVNTDEILRLAREFRKKADLPILGLDKETFRSFRELTELLSTLRTTDIYPALAQQLHQIYRDVQDAAPGTVGAYFTGCFRDHGFPGAAGCSAHCAGALQPGHSDWEACDTKVLVHQPGQKRPFQVKESPESSEAIIHVQDQSFGGFSTSELDHLERLGITHAQVFLSDGDDYQVLYPRQKIEELGRARSKLSTTTRQEGRNNGSGVGLGAAVLIIVVLFIIIVCCVRRRGY